MKILVDVFRDAVYIQAKIYGGANVELLAIVNKMCNIVLDLSRCCVECALART